MIGDTTGRLHSTWGPDCATPAAPSKFNDEETNKWESNMIFSTAVVFGAMHFITWSFSMATVIELWMWRSASIALTSLPVFVIAFDEARMTLEDSGTSLASIAASALRRLIFVCVFLHPVIRLITATDSVVLLRNLPDTALLVLSRSDAIPSL